MSNLLHAERLLKKFLKRFAKDNAKVKVIKVIRSCETGDQLKTAQNMIEMFEKRFGFGQDYVDLLSCLMGRQTEILGQTIDAYIDRQQNR